VASEVLTGGTSSEGEAGIFDSEVSYLLQQAGSLLEDMSGSAITAFRDNFLSESQRILNNQCLLALGIEAGLVAEKKAIEGARQAVADAVDQAQKSFALIASGSGGGKGIDLAFDLLSAVLKIAKTVLGKDPVTAMQRTKAIGLLWKQVKKDSCLSRMAIPDYLLTFRKPGDNPKPVHHTSEEFPVKQWQQWAECVWHDINPSNTLQRESARDEEDERHIAPLQLQVIERAVTMWTNPGDVVFTPFMGIGSEAYQAVKMGRRAIGIELKDSYYAQSVKNLQRAEAQQFSEQALFA